MEIAGGLLGEERQIVGDIVNVDTADLSDMVRQK